MPNRKIAFFFLALFALMLAAQPAMAEMRTVKFKVHGCG